MLGDLALGIVDTSGREELRRGAGVGTLEGAYSRRHGLLGEQRVLWPGRVAFWKLGVGKLQAVGRLQQAFSQKQIADASIIDSIPQLR